MVMGQLDWPWGVQMSGSALFHTRVSMGPSLDVIGIPISAPAEVTRPHQHGWAWSNQSKEEGRHCGAVCAKAMGFTGDVGPSRGLCRRTRSHLLGVLFYGPWRRSARQEGSRAPTVYVGLGSRWAFACFYFVPGLRVHLWGDGSRGGWGCQE